MGKDNWLPKRLDSGTAAAWNRAILDLDVAAAEKLITQHGVKADQPIDVPGTQGAEAAIRPLLYLLGAPDRGAAQAEMALMLLKNGADVGAYDGLGLRAGDHAVCAQNTLAGAYVFTVTLLSEAVGALPPRKEYPLHRAFARLGGAAERRAALRNFSAIHAQVRAQVAAMDEPYRAKIAALGGFWTKPFQMPPLRALPRPAARTLELADAFDEAAQKREELPAGEYGAWEARRDIEFYSSVRGDIRRASRQRWPQKKPK